MSTAVTESVDPGIEYQDGPIRVAREGTSVDPAAGRAVVIVRSVDGNADAVPVLRSTRAANLAVKYASAKGIAPAMFTSTTQAPYPATRTGATCVSPAERPDHYRVRFEFQRGGVL